MTDDFWARVRAAFEAAADAAPPDRAAALDAASGGDTAVRREALELLSRESDGFLAESATFALDAALRDAPLPVGGAIDGYCIVGLVGSGGMGEVYEATRAGIDFHKRVAIKVLRASTVSPDAVRRFERERRILAGLEHRNIAALFDGGVVADGRPYLVMEFVEGVRITQWCRSQRLGVDALLTLFGQICSAVSYAHRNLVVHRDLKPANILVAVDGTVKLLDFGIAKVLDDDSGLHGADTATRAGASGLTPAYAAPEQLTGGTITTATDVYALGLLLFELLTGTRPFAGATPSLPELTRVMLTTDPPMASATIDPLRYGAGTALARRRVRGDLDAILLKTLRTSPEARYGTVDELRDDLLRHQSGLPVAAMRGHRGYRLAKFVRRNRMALTAAGFVAVVVTTGIVSTGRASHRTSVQRARADATSRFLTEMLSSVDPAAAGREVPMVQVLDSAAARIARDSSLDPDVEASLRTAIGTSYNALGKSAEAAPHLLRALALRQRQPDDHVALATAYRDVGLLHDSRGEYAAADSFYRQGLDVLATDNDSTSLVLGTDLLVQRARIQSIDGNLAAAAAILRDVTARRRAQYGSDSREVALSLSQLGVTLTQQYQFAPAESTERAALAIFRRLQPEASPDVGKTEGRLAMVLDQTGNRAGADSAYRQSLASLAAALGADHPDVAWIRYNYAGFLLDGHEPLGAIAEADSVIRLRGGTIPETHVTMAGSYQLRGLAYASLNRHLDAERDLRESLALRRKYLAPGHWMIGSSESVLGNELWAGGQRVEALSLMQEGCRLVTRVLGPDNPTAKKARERLTQAGAEASSCSQL